MKKLLYILLVATLTASAYAIKSKDKNMKQISDEQIIHIIDSLIDADQPLSAEPYFAEAKLRARKSKNYVQLLSLLDKEIMLNASRLETNEEVTKMIDKEIAHSETPLTEALWLRKIGLVDATEVLKNTAGHQKKLMQHPASEIANETDLIVPMTAYDYTMLALKSSAISIPSNYLDKWEACPDSTSRLLYTIASLNNSPRVHLQEITQMSQLANNNRLKALCSMAEGIYYKRMASDSCNNITLSNQYADKAAELFQNAETLDTRVGIRAKAERDEISNMAISIETEKNFIPNKFIPLVIKTKNIKSVKVDVYKHKEVFDPDHEKALESYTIELPQIVGRIGSQSVYTELKGLDLGQYIIIAHHDTLLDAESIAISDITAVNTSPFDKALVTVVSSTTGEPLANATVNGKKVDKIGMVDMDIDKEGNKISVVNGHDKVDFNAWRGNRRNKDKESTRAALVTDRKVYKPGQTIKYKLYVYKANSEKMWADEGEKLKLKLTSNNGTNLHSTTVTSGDMGTAWGEIRIPDDVDLGNATLTADAKGVHAAININIEEYKRTNNKIIFDPITKAYAAGDTVDVGGYAIGADEKPIAGATIVINNSTRLITDETGHFLYKLKTYTEEEIEAYEDAADEMEYDDEDDNDDNDDTEDDNDNDGEEKTSSSKIIDIFEYFDDDDTYEVHAKMTDMSGETTEASTYIKIDEYGSSIEVYSSPTAIAGKDKLEFTINSQNSNDSPYAADVEYTIERLEYSNPYLIETHLSSDTVVGNYNMDIFNNNYKTHAVETVKKSTEHIEGRQNISIDTEGLKPGKYMITVITQSYTGKTITDQTVTSFIDYSASGNMIDRLYAKADGGFTPGQRYDNLYIGSRLDDVQIYVIASYGDKIFSKQKISCSNEIKRVAIDVPEMKQNYQDIYVSIFFTKNGRYHSSTISINKKKDTVNELDVELTTWRNTSEPGSNETAVLTLKNLEAGETAEVAATMYDTRLDKISSDNWHKDMFYKNTLYSNWLHSRHHYQDRDFINWKEGARTISNGSFNHNTSYRPLYSLIRVSTPSYYTHHYGYMSRPGNKMLMAARMQNIVEEESMAMMDSEAPDEIDESVEYEMSASDSQALQECAVVGYGVMRKSNLTGSVVEHAVRGIAVTNTENDKDILRSDFRETVFFEPSVRVDAKNNTATFNFTLPDNITTYALKAITHDKSMRQSLTEAQMVVSKAITVKAWLPRTVTEGDTIGVSMDINTSISEDSIETKLVCEEAEAIAIDKKHWMIAVPEGADSLHIIYQARGDKHADGEKHVIPVRKRNIEITESESFMLMTKGEHTISNPFATSSDSSTSKHTSIDATTLNYTANTWTEILRALPHLYTGTYPSSDTYLGQIESSGIALMLKQRDDVKAWINELKKSDAEALQNNHSENLQNSHSEDLQNSRAENLQNSHSENLQNSHEVEKLSPWKRQEKNMKKHDKEVLKMLSSNDAQRTMNKALGKLRDLQLKDGSFAWFKGMEGSEFMTRHIIETLGNMRRLGIIGSDVDDMCIKGRKYIETQIAKEIAEWDKQKIKSPVTDYTMLHELYTLTCVGRLDTNDKNIKRALAAIPSAKELGEPSMKLMTAIIYNRIDRKKEAKALLKSVCENLVRPDDLTAHLSLRGRSWWTNTTLTHSMLIFAINEMEPENADKLRIVNWLMKEKRSTHWNDTQATSRAVLALLTMQSDNRAADKITMTYLPEAETQTLPQTIEVNHIAHIDASKASKATIQHNGNFPSWGCWQQTALKPIDQMKAHAQNDISVSRSIEGAYKVGDKVTVTITVTTAVDMDFVRVSDYRPASFEPVDQKSEYRGYWWWRNRDVIPHYFSPRDESVDIFIERLPRGTHKFSYECYVTNEGEMNGGFAEAICMYEEGLDAHTEGMRIKVER